MLTRRTVLGAAAAVALTGCTARPGGVPSPSATATGASTPGVPASSQSPGASATPGPSTVQTRGAALELHAARQAAGLAAATDDRARRKLYTSLRTAQVDHLAALLSPIPTDRPAPGTATPAITPVAATRAKLQATLRSAATLYEPAAFAATGLDALLWGSLYVAARSADDVLGHGGSVAAPPVGRRPPAVLTETGALQEMVTQLHAMIFGYQLALGRLKMLSASHRRATTGLSARRDLRDRLIVELIDRSAEVPAAAAAYVPPVKVRNAATAALVIERMETAFRPFCGQWLASAETMDMRRQALPALLQTDDLARAWGGSAQVWPGWP